MHSLSHIHPIVATVRDEECDQIGPFLKDLGDVNFSPELPKYLLTFWAILKNIPFK